MAVGVEAARYVAAINAFSGGVTADAGTELGLKDPEEALEKLAGLAREGKLGEFRLPVLDALVKLASRHRLLLPYADEVKGLLEALVSDAGSPAGDAAVATAFAALEDITRQDDEDGAHAWQVFADATGEALQLETTEVERPQCNDTGEVEKRWQDSEDPHIARCVTVQFYADVAPGAMRAFCDPMQWHKLSPYQQGMVELSDRSTEAPGDGWWRQDLEEKVELFPKVTLETPLRFTYSIEKPDDPAWVHLDYVQLTNTGHIHVDEGALDVRRVTSGPQRGRTRVSAKKLVCFDEKTFQDWTTIACDTFWTDTVVAAAVQSADNGGG